MQRSEPVLIVSPIAVDSRNGDDGSRGKHPAAARRAGR
jgi:hypothetical protein